MSEPRLSIVNDGRMAEAALTYFNEIIEDRKAVIYNGLKSLARDRTHDLTNYVSSVSALNALEDLQKELHSKMKLAKQKESEIINGKQY